MKTAKPFRIVSQPCDCAPYLICMDDDDLTVVAQIIGGERIKDRTAGHAALFAQSPRLAAALRRSIEYIEDHDCECEHGHECIRCTDLNNARQALHDAGMEV